MSDDTDTDTDRRTPRVDWEKLKQGPTPADLAAIPATTADDWQDAEIISPLPKDIAHELASRSAILSDKTPS